MVKGYTILKECYVDEEVVYNVDENAFFNHEDAIEYLEFSGYEEVYKDKEWHEFRRMGSDGDWEFSIIRSIDIY